MKHNHRKNQAVAGVIEALLLVALAAIIISTIQLVYIPDVMEQRESDHMDDINNQYALLKSMIDLQSMTNSSSPISSMITLGSSELPYFITARSFGEIYVEEDANYQINIDYNSYTYPLTSIVYNAKNTYFVDQTYVLQGGGFIVSQPTGLSVMRVAPSISATNGSDIDITYTLPIFSGLEGKNYTYGSGSCFVRTSWSSGTTQSYSSVNSINITTDYPNAWNETLVDALGENANIDVGNDYIEITKKTKDINFNIRTYTISVQIGLGWIK